MIFIIFLIVFYEIASKAIAFFLYRLSVHFSIAKLWLLY